MTLKEPTAVRLSADDIATKIRDDLDYLAAVLIPDIAEAPFPPFYKEVWAYMLQSLHTLPIQDTFRFALGLPRGHAKTTFIKLFVCYLVIHDYDIDFIQVVCSTEPLAENFLTDVHNMLQSQIITQVYGSWSNSLSRDTMKVKKANWNGRKMILLAIGAGTSTRGINLDNRRPNLILLDDAQTKENDESDVDRNKLLLWLVGTLFKSLTKTKRKSIIYIGNMYSEVCILYVFSKLSQWISLITGAILADGTALWPAIQTVEQAKAEYDHDNALGMGSVWFAEVQNDPVGSLSGLLELGEEVPPLPLNDYHDLDYYPIRFICIDPAGFKSTSDDNVIAVHCLKEGDNAGTVTVQGGKWSPAQTIEHTLVAAIRWGVGIVFVEAAGYQSTLAFWLEEAIKENELDIKVIPLTTGNAKKYQRIKAWVKQLVAGKWEIFEQKTYNKITYQLYQYRTNRKDNIDDVLDVCAQGVLAINKHGIEIVNSRPRETEKGPIGAPALPQGNSRMGALRKAMSQSRA